MSKAALGEIAQRAELEKELSMGASREGHRLWHAAGRFHAWSYIKRRGLWKGLRGLYWSDTFMPIVCAIVGHDKYDCADPWDKKQGIAEYACRRCHQYLR